MAVVTRDRTWNNVPVRITTDTSTGETKVSYKSVNPILGTSSYVLIASSSSNKWTTTSELGRAFRTYNPNSRSSSDVEVEAAFQREGRKVFDNDRASILNARTNYDTQEQFENNTRAFKALNIPRIRDPFSGLANNSNGVTQTEITEAAVAPPSDPQGGSIRKLPASVTPDNKGVTIEVMEGGIEEQEEIMNAIKYLNTLAPPVLRYPLANLDVAKELGISYDYIKIRVIDYVGSLDKGDFLKSGNSNLPTTKEFIQGQTSQGASQGANGSDAPNNKVFDRYLQNQKTYAYVILPMQPNLSASNSTSWGEDSANILQLVAGQITNSYFQNVGAKGAFGEGTLRDAGNNLYQAANQIVNTSVESKAEIAALLAGYVVNTNLLQRATGSVINPNLEMLFNGPRLRTFNFTFDMTPRFKEEAEEVRQIIKTFKKYMAPEKRPGNAFLKAPKIFLLNYIYNGDVGPTELESPWDNNPKDHPYLNKIKPCALTAFDVNYTPAGSYMTYSDGGSMTTYQISMSFSEIEPIYSNDIDLDANHMGY